MTELKTLKDFLSKGETHGFREKWISETELKAEAVKWVKEFYTKENKEAIKFIIHFFNLTEDDLK